jgi:hypothetical protein
MVLWFHRLPHIGGCNSTAVSAITTASPTRAQHQQTHALEACTQPSVAQPSHQGLFVWSFKSDYTAHLQSLHPTA